MYVVFTVFADKFTLKIPWEQFTSPVGHGWLGVSQRDPRRVFPPNIQARASQECSGKNLQMMHLGRFWHRAVRSPNQPTSHGLAISSHSQPLSIPFLHLFSPRATSETQHMRLGADLVLLLRPECCESWQCTWFSLFLPTSLL